MRTIKELIELAEAGEAAEFTNSIQEALKGRALEKIVDIAEDDEDEEELDFDLDDDIEDLEDDSEDDLEEEDDDLEEDVEELDERNALNHQKARAFRAGGKEVRAKDMHVPDKRYMSRRDKWSGEGEKKIEAQKAAKMKAGADAKHMAADATEKGASMGAKVGTMKRITTAGKRYREANKSDRPSGNVWDNARAKEYNHGQGRFLHQHLSKQHMHLSRQADDLHNEISRALNSDTFRGRDEKQYGSIFRFKHKDDDDGPALQPHHLENLKKLHQKLSAIHHVVKSMNEDAIDWDVIEEDLLDIENEYVELLSELDEGNTYSRKNWDDDRLRAKGKAKKYSRRRDRRSWKMRMEDIEPGSLSLADDLTDEELQDLADNITEEHFELLDELSTQKLAGYMTKAASDRADARLSFNPTRAHKRGKGIAKASAMLARK